MKFREFSFLCCIFLSLFPSINAEDHPFLVVATTDGHNKAINVSDIDSIYFLPNVSEDSIMIWNCDTIHEVDSIYYINPDYTTQCPTYMDKMLSKDKPFKVLDIGNSFTDDATAYLNDVVKASGSDVSNMCLYKLVRASADFRSWVNVYNGKDFMGYVYRKVFGEIPCDVTGSGGANSSELMRNVLNNVKWDLIIIHPVSSNSDQFEQWGPWSNNGALDSLLSILKENQPQAEIGFMIVHSSLNNCVSANQTTAERWRKIVDAARKMKKKYGISFYVPYGTAVENLRMSSVNTSSFLSRDNHHLAYGLPRYAAACAYYQALVAPRSGISVLGNSFRSSSSTANFINVTDETAPIAQMAAFLATAFWWKNLNPEDYLDK